MTEEKRLLNSQDVFAELDADPEARARRERLALARAAGDAVIRFRIEHKLSQRALAAKLGMRQSHIARLEASEHNPSLDMLQRLARELGLRFILDVSPAGKKRLALKLPTDVRVVEGIEAAGGERVLVAAG